MKTIQVKIHTCWFFVLIFLHAAAACAHGAGFSILQQGTGAMGQGNAFSAQADDPSAVFFNPAGIVQLEGIQVYTGGTFIVPNIRYKGEVEDETVSRVYFPPYLYLTNRVKDGLALGLGIFSPFGLSTVWHEDWEGRYISTYSRLTTMDLNPTLAYRHENLSLALGLNALSAELVLRKRLPLYYVNGGLPDGTQELSGRTWGYGYNLGLLYGMGPGWSLGISYRSRIRLDFDHAESRFEVPQSQSAFFRDTGARGTLELPPSLTCGVCWRPAGHWSVEFDMTWTGWSTYDEVKIEFEEPVGYTQSEEFRQPKRWRDVMAYRFGLKYLLSDALNLRLGYIYDQSPVPSSTFDPQLPDGNRQVYAFGLDCNLGRKATLGLAYNYIHVRSRYKYNEILEGLLESDRANGEYRQDIHSVGLSLLYRF